MKTVSATRLHRSAGADPYHLYKLLHPYHLKRARTLLDGRIPPPSTIKSTSPTERAPSLRALLLRKRTSPRPALDRSRPAPCVPRAAYANGTLAFELVGGGEPTNHPRIGEIIERIHGLGATGPERARIGLVTNGVRLNRILTVAHRLEWIRVSLDAADETTYCELHGVRAEQEHYADVLSNIRALGERVDVARIRLAYLVVPPINHQRDKIIAAATDLASEIGVQHVAFRPALISHATCPEDWWEAANAIREAKRRHGGTLALGGTGGSWDQVLGVRPQPTGPCRTRPLIMVIKADGTIPSCILFRERPSERPPLGNIADGFDAAWFSERHRRSLAAVSRSTCPTVCKHFRADGALDEIEDASANGYSAPAIEADMIDNPHFI